MKRFLFSLYLSILFACAVNTGDTISKQAQAETSSDAGIGDAMDQFDEGLINPTATRGAWSTSGTLRTPAPTGPGGLGERGTESVSLQAVFDEPGVYTVQFALVARLPNAPFDFPLVAQARAEITWSVEGNQITRIVDLTDGCSVVGLGQGVRVVVRDVTPLQTIPQQTPYDYTIGISVTKGTKNSAVTPPTYKLASAVTMDTDKTFAIPHDAGANALFVYPGFDAASPPTNGVIVIGVDQFNTPQFSYRLYANEIPTWVPLVPGVERIRVVRITGIAADPIALTVLLGIDG